MAVVNLQEENDEHRDQEKSDPSSTSEFCEANYNESYPSRQSSHAIQDRLWSPPSLAFAPPVPHHTNL
jgi:hypothetical protein